MSGAPSASGFAFYSSQGELLQRLTLAAEDGSQRRRPHVCRQGDAAGGGVPSGRDGPRRESFRFERMKAALHHDTGSRVESGPVPYRLETRLFLPAPIDQRLRLLLQSAQSGGHHASVPALPRGDAGCRDA